MVTFWSDAAWPPDEHAARPAASTATVPMAAAVRRAVLFIENSFVIVCCARCPELDKRLFKECDASADLSITRAVPFRSAGSLVRVRGVTRLG
ncbi:hypothetical protein GCM10017714_24680 [Curtobacterium pusillum]|nr:hypothetical protein GCM10017610_28840 [Curtobacterium pusillum]